MAGKVSGKQFELEYFIVPEDELISSAAIMVNDLTCKIHVFWCDTNPQGVSPGRSGVLMEI